jgi:hypothetical protein
VANANFVTSRRAQRRLLFFITILFLFPHATHGHGETSPRAHAIKIKKKNKK